MFKAKDKTLLIAELSANHNGSLARAKECIHAMAESGADAVKLQTYLPETLTIDCDNEYFKIKGTQWAGKTLFELYGEAFTPWEWHEELFDLAKSLKLCAFSTPFDHTAVDFLEGLKVPIHKVASFEIVDIPLLKKIGETGKPVIMSTGMASIEEISDAVNALKTSGTNDITLLKCTSAYPASPEEMNLSAIPDLKKRFKVPTGLSDHTLGIEIPIAAVALGATVIEKHFTLSRSDSGPDSNFSLEPSEFREMVQAIRNVEIAIGTPCYGTTEREIESKIFRRSLFAVKNIMKGESFTKENVRSIRPGFGLPPKNWDRIMLCKSAKYIARGTPLEESMIEQMHG